MFDLLLLHPVPTAMAVVMVLCALGETIGAHRRKPAPTPAPAVLRVRSERSRAR